MKPDQKRIRLRIKLGYPAIKSVKDAFTMVKPFGTIQGTQSIRHLYLHSNFQNPTINETYIEPVHPMLWIRQEEESNHRAVDFFKILYLHTSG